MPWNRNYKKEQQPKIVKRLVVKSRASILPDNEDPQAHQAAIILEVDKGKYNAYVFIKSYLGSNSFVKAWDKAHYTNANTVQYGRELGTDWALLCEAVTFAELKAEGFQL